MSDSGYNVKDMFNLYPFHRSRSGLVEITQKVPGSIQIVAKNYGLNKRIKTVTIGEITTLSVLLGMCTLNRPSNDL